MLASSEASDDSSVEMTAVAAGMTSASQQVARPPINPEPRRIDIPLTYQDLEQPIDQPVAIQRRFSATAMVREKQLEQERVAGLVMPAMEALATSQQEELKRVAESVSSADIETGQAAGRLASALSSEKQVERLPEAQSAERPRHWIRQPN